MRKVLFGILGVIVISAIGWYLYAKSHQTQPGVPSITDFSSFFPVGETTDPTLGVAGVLPDGTPSGTVSQVPKPSPFKQVSANAVAGYSIFSKPVSITIPPDPTIKNSKATTQTIIKQFIRYVSRPNGYVYEVEGDTMPLQISNVYIPNIYEASFGTGSDTAFLRFLRGDQQTIATYNVPVPPPNTDGTRTQKKGVYFPDNITAFAVSPDGSQVARINSDQGGAVLSTSSTINTKKVELLRTPFTEWILSWPTAKSLYMQTKASAQVPGFLYRLDTSEKKLRRVLGDINGLTTSVSPSGTYIIYSQHSDNGFVTNIFNTKTNTTKSLNLALLPEKCTWLKNEDLICAGNTTVPKGEYPDNWYQGTMSFSDKIYRIYTSSMLYDTLYDNTGSSFDMTNLSVDEVSNKLYFIDKPTGLLWQMKY